MKKSLVGVILASVFLFAPNIVTAASSCSYSEQAELNNIAANVKTTYEPVLIKDGTGIDVDSSTKDNTVYVDIYVKGFNINIINVTKDIYVKVTNDKDDKEHIFENNGQSDGIYTFQSKKSDEMVTYTIEIYANKYDCSGELLRRYTMITPMYNSYSEFQICKDNPEFYYCQEFISTQNVSYDTFYKKINEYKNKKVEEEQKENEKNIWDKIKEFYQNNKVTIYIVSGVIVITGVTTTAILIKKRRSRVL